MSNLKVVLLILVAILVMSCNSNEPEIYDGIIGGPGQNGILNEDPTVDPKEELHQATLLFYAEKYDEALVALRNIVEKYKNETTGSFGSPIEFAKSALVYIERIYEETGRSDKILSMLEGYSQGDNRFAMFARERTAYQYFHRGEYNKTIEILKGLKYGKEDAYYDQWRLFFIGYTYWVLGSSMMYVDGNEAEAYRYFSEGRKYCYELIDTYPDCEAASMARGYL
jgi:tetratricopeptide (TPR) repeat protein